MSKDEGPAERLVESISEFRIELIEWIDSQLSSLSESETWAASGVGAIAPGKGLSAQPEALLCLHPQPITESLPRHPCLPRFRNRLPRSIPGTGLTPWRGDSGND